MVNESTVPVIETGTGNCHVYVDAQADIDTAVEILVNSKAQRVSVCNAAETLLVHQDIAAEFLPRALDALAEAGVTVHADERVMAYAKDSKATVVEATAEDWETEYLSHDIAAAVVDSLDKAVEHIRLWTSGHTEAIVTTSQQAAPPLHPAGRLHHRRRERLHPFHRRRPVRLRRRDRHLHPEAARPRPHGPAGADQHEVHRHR